MLTGDIPLRLDVFVEVGLDKTEPLLNATFDISTTLAYIAEDLVAPAISHSN